MACLLLMAHQGSDSISGVFLQLQVILLIHQHNICNCPCSKNGSWPHEIPSFVGNSYFCDSGNEYGKYATDGRVYADDPLWDGKGCGFNSTCCEFNNPP